MNRRSFIKTLTAGLVSIVAVSRLPVDWFPPSFQLPLVHKKMILAWNNFMKGHGANQMPAEVLAGPLLFAAYELQTPIIHRWVPVHKPDGYKRLMFKSGTLRDTGDESRPWAMELINRDRTRRLIISDIRYSSPSTEGELK